MFDPISPNYYKIDDDLELYHLTQWLMGNSAQSVQYLFRSTRIDGQWKDDQARIQDINKAIFFSNLEKDRLAKVKSSGKELSMSELATPEGVKVMDITQWLPGNAAQAVFLLSRASMQDSPGSTKSKVEDVVSAIALMEAEKKRVEIEIRHKESLEGASEASNGDSGEVDHEEDSTPVEGNVKPAVEPEIEHEEEVTPEPEPEEDIEPEEEPEDEFSLLSDFDDDGDTTPKRGMRRKANKGTLWSAQ